MNDDIIHTVIKYGRNSEDLCEAEEIKVTKPI